MKAFSKTILVTALLSLVLISCGTTSGAKKENDCDQCTEEMNKRTISANGIGNLVKGNSLEGAYYRMDRSYQSNKSFQEFCNEWKLLTDNSGSVLDYTVDVSEYSSLNFYKPIKVIYKFADKEVTARYLYTAASLFPTDVIYDDSTKSISTAIVPLKDLCKDYFKIGCGITGAYSGNSAIRVPQFMDIVKQSSAAVLLQIL